MGEEVGWVGRVTISFADLKCQLNIESTHMQRFRSA